MTEEQQKYYEELQEELRQEEEICDSCRHRNEFANHCEGCDVGDMIRDMQFQMQELLC